MSGGIFSADRFLGLANNMDNTSQPAPQIDPRVIQAILASQAPSLMMSQGSGAARFLTGDTGIPLTYGVDVPAYTPFSMTPGPFADFMAAQDFSDSKNPVIPVFDPVTGRYTSSRQGSMSAGGDGGVSVYDGNFNAGG